MIEAIPVNEALRYFEDIMSLRYSEVIRISLRNGVMKFIGKTK